MGGKLARDKGLAKLPTFKVLVVGDVGSGKTAVIRRYTHNQFIVDEHNTKCKLAELTVHSVQLPGIQESVGVVFWKVPVHSFNLVKKEQYMGMDAVIVVAKAPLDKDPDSLLSLWRHNILKDSPQRDLPFILLLNRFKGPKSGWSMETEITTEHSNCSNRYEVYPYSGDDSVHRPLNRLLWQLVEKQKARTKLYPTSVVSPSPTDTSLHSHSYPPTSTNTPSPPHTSIHSHSPPHNVN